MSKSKYSKVTSAGNLAGVSRYGKQFGKDGQLVLADNRQMRRAINKVKEKHNEK